MKRSVAVGLLVMKGDALYNGDLLLKAEEHKSWLTFYDQLLYKTMTDDFSPGNADCMALAQSYLDARTTMDCTDPTYACTGTEINACCERVDATLQYVNISDDHCNEVYDDECCLFCLDEDSAGYPFACTPETYVSVSLCATDDNTPGIVPLPEGWECDATEHEIDGYVTIGTWHDDTQQDDEIAYEGPSCADLDSNFAAGKDYVWFYDETFGDSDDDFESDPQSAFFMKQMVESGALLFRPALNGGSVTFSNTNKCVIILNPLNSGSMITDMSSDTDIRVFAPYNFAIASPLMFSGSGKVTVIDGENFGTIGFNTTGDVELSFLNNYGLVDFTKTSNAFLGGIVNEASGVVSFVDVEAAFVNVTNKGAATFNMGKYKGVDISNENTVTFDNCEVEAYFVANTGSITFTASTSGTVCAPTGSAVTNNSPNVVVTFSDDCSQGNENGNDDVDLSFGKTNIVAMDCEQTTAMSPSGLAFLEGVKKMSAEGVLAFSTRFDLTRGGLSRKNTFYRVSVVQDGEIAHSLSRNLYESSDTMGIDWDRFKLKARGAKFDYDVELSTTSTDIAWDANTFIEVDVTERHSDGRAEEVQQCVRFAVLDSVVDSSSLLRGAQQKKKHA